MFFVLSASPSEIKVVLKSPVLDKYNVTAYTAIMQFSPAFALLPALMTGGCLAAQSTSSSAQPTAATPPARLAQAAPGVAARPGAAAKIKNVVIIFADDQGAQLGALGTPGISTPNVDALAKNGVMFTQAYATCASCSPSRSSLLTGMFPHSNGHWRNTVTPVLTDPEVNFTKAWKGVDQVGIHEDIPTLNEILGKAGYFRGITQKLHLSPPWKYPFDARNPVSIEADGFERVIGDYIQQAGDKPFFIQANVAATHRPFPPHLKALEGPLPDINKIPVMPYLPDTPAMRADLQEYFGTVNLADQCAGGILKALDKAGVRGNTLVIYTSDQGEGYHRAKASAYAAGTHVPLVFEGPGLVKDVTSDILVSETDLMPTILDFVGLPIPATVQGKSLKPLLTGATQTLPDRKYVFTEHNSHGPAEAEIYPSRAVFDGRYYYIVNLIPGKQHTLPADLEKSGPPWFNGSYDAAIAAKDSFPTQYAKLQELLHGRPPEELYDMQFDAGQLYNLAGDTANRAKLLELREEMAKWRRETGDYGSHPREIVRRTAPEAKF